jgi:hypothetical protein
LQHCAQQSQSQRQKAFVALALLENAIIRTRTGMQETVNFGLFFFSCQMRVLTATQLDTRAKSLNQTDMKQRYKIYTAKGFTLKHLYILSYCMFESYFFMSCFVKLHATEVNTISFLFHDVITSSNECF